MTNVDRSELAAAGGFVAGIMVYALCLPIVFIFDPVWWFVSVLVAIFTGALVGWKKAQEISDWLEEAS